MDRAHRPGLPAAAVAALVGACLVQQLTTLPAAPVAWALVGLSLTLVIGLRRGFVVFFAWLLLGASWAVVRADRALAVRIAPTEEGVDLRIRGRVHGLPQTLGDGIRFDLAQVELEGRPREGLFRLRSYGAARIEAGAEVDATVRLRRPRGSRNPGGVDFERLALQRRLAATGYVRSLHAAGPAEGLDAWRDRVAGTVAARHQATTAALLRALSVGDTRGLSDEDWARLRATGTTHLVAISGFHVGLVAGFGALLARGLRQLARPSARAWPRPVLAASAAAIAAFAYAIACGASLPVLRTATMIALVAAARAARRRIGGLEALGLAALAMLGLDPLAVLGAGFWLSFVGVAWLVLCVGSARGEGALPWRSFGRAQAATTLGLLPITALYFQQTSVVGPIANAVAVPWVSVLVLPMVLAATGAAALWPAAGERLGEAAGWLLRPLVLLLEAAPPQALEWSLAPPGVLALSLAVLAALWALAPRGLGARGLALLMLLPLLWPARKGPAHGDFELTVLDVGQGSAVLIRTHQSAVLYDAGPSFRGGGDAAEHVVVPSARALGIARLDRLVLSHGDDDHAGGGERALTVLAPQEVFVGPDLVAVAPWATHARPCVAGAQWARDGVVFSFLHPPANFPPLGNPNSCVLRVQGARASALLMGDLPAVLESRLIAQGELSADVLLVSHHGARDGTGAALLTAVGPRHAAISVGHRNRFGHPHRDTVARLEASGATIARTDRHGALVYALTPAGALDLTLRWRPDRRRYWHER